MTTPNPWAVQRAIRKAKGLNPAARLMLLEIMDRAANWKGECWASAKTLGEGVNVDERQARRLMKTLEEGGWILVGRDAPSKYASRRKIIAGPMLAIGGEDAPGQLRPGGHEVHPDIPVAAPGHSGLCTRSSMTVHPDNCTPLTSPGTSPMETSPENVSALSEREGERIERLSEAEQREFWGDAWVEIYNETRPPVNAWWAMEPYQTLALSEARRNFGEKGGELVLKSSNILMTGKTTWNDVAAAFVIAGERNRSSIANLGPYVGSIARQIASDDQEVPEHVDAQLDHTWDFLREERIKAEAAWHDRATREALTRHMPGALRAIQALEAIDEKRGVDPKDGEAGSLAIALPMLGKLINDDWDAFLGIIQDVFESNQDATLMDVYRIAMPERDSEAA